MKKPVEVVGMTHRYESLWFSVYGEQLNVQKQKWGSSVGNVMFPSKFFIGIDRLYYKVSGDK